jgi:hypothetical protein
MIPSAIGIGLLIALGFWIFGGLALRLGGVLLILVSAVGIATTGDADGILAFTFGIAFWWIGHLHYALRHGFWKNPLASCAVEGTTRGLIGRLSSRRRNWPCH